MQGTEACQILNNNQWISNVAVAGSGDRQRYVADISPDGHRLLCELGYPAFSTKLIAMLPPGHRRGDCLEFRHVHGWILDGQPLGGKDNKPGILSLLSALNQHRLLLSVGGDLVYFQGHFPGNPIFPGIAQLHWAAIAAMRLFEFVEVPYEIKRLKFRNIIRPSSVLELVLESKNAREVEFRFVSFAQVHSTGCLCFREELSC